MTTNRREFIGAGVGIGLAGSGLAWAQQTAANRAPAAAKGNTPPIPVRKGKITKLFKSPEGHPNGIALAANGWWIAEQKSDNAVLVDWDGKLLKTVKTESKNTSGIAFGGGYVWMGANSAPNGIFQTDLTSKTISHRQIPLGGEQGGGCHGVLYNEGKLWIAALRLRGILRVDAKTWEPEYLISYAVFRAHGVAWDNGAIWMVTGSAEGKAGLIKYDASNGRTLETVEFDELYPDPHGLAIKDGVMYTSDAGIHPGWEDNVSTAHGYVCRIDIA
jgi:hypothetical protein